MPNPFDPGMRSLGYAIFGDPRAKAQAAQMQAQQEQMAMQNKLYEAQTGKALGETVLGKRRLTAMDSIQGLNRPTPGIGVYPTDTYQGKEAVRNSDLASAVALAFGNSARDASEGMSNIAAQPMIQSGNSDAIRRAMVLTGQGSGVDTNFAPTGADADRINSQSQGASLNQALQVQQARSLGDQMMARLFPTLTQVEGSNLADQLKLNPELGGMLAKAAVGIRPYPTAYGTRLNIPLGMEQYYPEGAGDSNVASRDLDTRINQTWSRLLELKAMQLKTLGTSAKVLLNDDIIPLEKVLNALLAQRDALLGGTAAGGQPPVTKWGTDANGNPVRLQ